MSFKFTRMGKKLIRRTGYHMVPTIAHYCPACRGLHDYAVEQPFRNGAKWTFNGNNEKPSFQASMNISWGPDSKGRKHTCHYYVTDGQIIYENDCHHELRGQRLDLPDIPEQCLTGNEEV